MKKTLSVVCPVYNEAEGVGVFYERLKGELDALAPHYDSSILFVVDGGGDGSFEILSEIAKRDQAVQVIKLSRNFGHQTALVAGIDYAEGDLVITMDSDLQHPPSLIPTLIEEQKKGNEVVLTIRKTSEDVPPVERLAVHLFYRLVNAISSVPIKENASDFRLITRKVADIIRRDIHERDLFLRGLVSWLGFRHTSVPFSAPKRFAGKTKYSLMRRVRFALSGMVSFSTRPLRIALFAGIAFAFLAVLYAFYTLLIYIAGQAVPGWSSVIFLLSFLSAVQLIVIGVLGEYLGVIFDEVKARPRYVIDETIGVAPRVR